MVHMDLALEDGGVNQGQGQQQSSTEAEERIREVNIFILRLVTFISLINLSGVGTQPWGRVQGDLQNCLRVQLCGDGHRISRGGSKTYRRIQVNLWLPVSGTKKTPPLLISKYHFFFHSFWGAMLICWRSFSSASPFSIRRAIPQRGFALGRYQETIVIFKHVLNSPCFSSTSSSTCLRTCMLRTVLSFSRF